MSTTKTYICTSRYYSSGRLYEPGERITVPAGAPKSRTWRELDEPAKESERLPQGPEIVRKEEPKEQKEDSKAESKQQPKRLSDKSL